MHTVKEAYILKRLLAFPEKMKIRWLKMPIIRLLIKNGKCRMIVMSRLFTSFISIVLTAKRRMNTFDKGESGQTIKYRRNSGL